MAAKAKNAGVAPGKKRVTTVEEIEVDAAPAGELDLETGGEEGEGGDDFLDVLAELAGGSEAKCEVRRTSPSDFAGYCCTYALSEMQANGLDRLQEEWGGGKFNIRVRNARGEFKGSTSVQIAGKSKNRGDGVLATPVAMAPAGPDLGAIITAATASSKSQIDMLTSLVTALINKPAPPPPPAGPDTLEIIAQLAPLLRPEKSGTDETGAVKLLLQGIELGKEFAGGGGEESMLGIASKGMEMVTKLAASAPARPRPRPAPAPQPRPALAAPVATAAPGTVAAEGPAEDVEIVNPQDPPMLKLLNWIRQQTTLLCYQAARKKDPQLYAELFLDNIPQGVSLDTIYEQMNSPDAIQKLSEINADVLKYPEWMEEFRQCVLAGLIETPDAPTAPGGMEGPIEMAEGGDGGGNGNG